ncbi:MAG TPA: hypothetical protein VHU87_02580 [Rhizomicrobium sp.]|jgi:hypothetical protein|nr:hypothetical protein [Rhizomicrobium sp.]
MKLARLAALLCVALCAAACLPVTTAVPVGSTMGLTPDPALAGIWKGHGQKLTDILYLSFFPKDDGTITALALKPDGKDGGWAVYSIQTASLGAYKFMNAREVSSDGNSADGAEAQEVFPLLYRVNGDGALVIYLLDEKRAASAIKSGKIAGTIDPSAGGDVKITATATDLDAFMQTPDGRALFVKPLAIFRREK